MKIAVCRMALYVMCMLIIACNSQRKNEWIEQHNEFNNHWTASIEVGFVFKGAYIDTAGNAWATSASGIILYRPKGGNWVKEELPVENRRLYCIAGRGNEVWVSGEEGVILYKKTGQPWVKQQQKGGLLDLNSICVAENDVWIVGSGGVILHKKNNTEWVVEKCPEENAMLTAIKGTPDNLWIISENGLVLHKATNGNWLKETIPMPSSKLTDLLVQHDDVWITGDSGILFHKTNNTKWILEKTVAGKVRLDNIFGWDNQVWVTADYGTILNKKGNDAWRIEKKHPLNGYFLGGHQQHHDIWLAGSQNVILHKHENDPWVQEVTPASPEILTTVAANGAHVIAAGFNETILDKNAAGKWETTHEIVTAAPLNGIYALDDEAWVADNKGNILYKNRDNNWEKEPSGLSTLEIKDGYRYGDDIWLIGEPAVILHKQGNRPWLNETPNVVNNKLNAIYGRNDEVWVAGNNSILLYKKSGSEQWVNDYDGKNVNHFNSITAIGDDLYALSSSVTILHKKTGQQNWVPETINPREVQDLKDGHFHAICKTDSGLYAVGGFGLILCKKNQGDWMREDIDVKGIDLKDMAVLDGTVYVVGNIGERGVILYKRPGKDWVKLEMPWTNFLKIIKYRGICLITKTGYLYKENDSKNFLSKRVVNNIADVTGAAACSGQLYFAAKNSIIKARPDQRQYPTVTRLRYFTSSLFHPDSLEIQFTLQSPPREKYKDMRSMSISVFARTYNDWQTAEENYRPVVGSSRLIDSTKNSFTFAFRFEIANNFRITPASDIANKLVVKVIVSSNTEGVTEEITLKDKDGNQFLAISNDVWHNNKGWLMGVLAFLFYYIFFLLLWLIKPLWFLKIYRFEFFKQLASLKPPFKQLLIIVDILLPLRLLAYKTRVLDAWIRANKNVLTQQFNDNKTVSTKSDYISLPIRIDDQQAGKIINEPDAKFCIDLFNTKRTIVQLIGQGGAGKTMLAVAMGRWMMQPHRCRKKNIIRIPVLIESDTNDLLQSLKDQFHAWFNMPKVDEVFLISLLKQQRLVIIIDAFSELSVEKQTGIRNIHASLPVNALFITSRHEVQLQANVCTRLYLTPFDSESLVHFITQLLDEKKGHPLTKFHDQIIFAKEIVRLIHSQGKNKGITPMLVKLIIDNALSKVTASTGVEEMFTTIPEFIPKVYYDYLCNTHPVHETAPNFLSVQQVVALAEEMALLSLKEDFIPRDFKEGDILPDLLADPQFRDINPVDRLIENGIIARRNSLGVFYLRFNLDTMAEYLGASRLFDNHRDDPHQLSVIIDKVNRLGDEAAGFKMAFEHIKEYKLKNG